MSSASDSSAVQRILDAVSFINEARKLNEAEQKKHAGCTTEWHVHETIDDKLHEALLLLGD